MEKSRLNFIIDVLAFLTFIISCTSGIVIWLLLPGGSSGLNLLFNLTRGNWKSMHIYSSLLLSFLIILHILLHWKWIKGKLKSIFS
ncbi:DUF4405 domain-containing protein [Natroniella acetigena]|uniref:DUF4405 domain-containing protein n=1 Tax=Natroniella acetigena TaxID=52004 RepID=UPI003D15BB96